MTVFLDKKYLFIIILFISCNQTPENKTEEVLETKGSIEAIYEVPIKLNEDFISKYNKIKSVTNTMQKGNTPLLLLLNSVVFFELITQKSGTGNLIQAQRDYFGSHGVKLIKSNKILKYNWNDFIT